MLIPPAVRRQLVERGLHADDVPADPPCCTHCTRPVQILAAPWGGWLLPPLCEVCQERADREDARDDDRRRKTAASAAQLRAAGLTDGEIASTDRIGLDALDLTLRELPKISTASWGYVWSPEPGCGKTTQLLLAVRHYLGDGWRCRYTTQSDLLASLRPRDGGLAARMTHDQWAAYDLVALDEVGRPTTAWGEEQLLELLDRRYREHKATLLASNYTLEQLVGAPGWGSRVVTRIRERAGGRLDAHRARLLELTYSHRRGEIASAVA